MADGENGYLISRLLKSFHRLFHGFARTADNGLVFAVDIGDHDITIHAFENALDFGEWGEYRGHAAVVIHREGGHFAPASAHRFHRICEWHASHGDQRSIFTQAMTHREIGRDAISGEQPR